MKQGTLKTLGMVALGAAAVVAGTGTASAASGPVNVTSVDRLTGTVIGSLQHQQQLGHKAAKQLTQVKLTKNGQVTRSAKTTKPAKGKAAKRAKAGHNTVTVKKGKTTKSPNLLGGLPIGQVQAGNLTGAVPGTLLG